MPRSVLQGDDFINLVVGFETGLPLPEVIDRLHEAEAACGRERASRRSGPRARWTSTSCCMAMKSGMNRVSSCRARTCCVVPTCSAPPPKLRPTAMHPTQHASLGELWRKMQASEAHPMTPVDLAWPDRAAPADRAVNIGCGESIGPNGLDSDAATAIHGEHLSRHVRRVGDEENTLRERCLRAIPRVSVPSCR